MTLTITYPDGTVFEVTPDDTSYRHREVMGEDALTLKFSSPVHVELPVGSWCEFQGTRYTLYRPEALTMHHSRSFEYTVTMEAEQWLAGIWMFRDVTDGRVSFTLTAKPYEHLKLLVDNLNARAGEGHWEVGDCVDAEEACIGYDRVRCSEALDLMAEAFGTEWEFAEEEVGDGVTRRTVSLHKVEYDTDDPLELSYGRGQGLKPDVGRANSSDDPPVEILFPQGGTDNIDASRYPQDIHAEGEYPSDVERPKNSAVLLLPPGRRIGVSSGPTFHYWDDAAGGWEGPTPNFGFRGFVVDGQGYSLTRMEGDLGGWSLEGGEALGAEDSLDCTDICPKRVGTVAEVIAVDGTDDDGKPQQWYDFTDADPDDDPCPDYGECLMDRETMTVIFQSGALAGREFEVNYVHSERRFEVVSEFIDGVLMPQGPGEAFGINPGDTYAVFGCMLPNEYICNDASHSGAEWDMLRECAVYMYDRGEEHPYITGKADGIFFRDNWGEVAPKVRPGCRVLFRDERFEPDGLLIRVVGVKDYINSPQSPELELSDETLSGGIRRTMIVSRSESLKNSDGTKAVNDRLRRLVGNAGRTGIARRFEDLDTGVDDLEDAVYGGGDDVSDGLLARTYSLEETVNGDGGLVATTLSIVDAINGTEGQDGIADAVNALIAEVNDIAKVLNEVCADTGSNDGGYSGKIDKGDISKVDPGILSDPGKGGGETYAYTVVNGTGADVTLAVYVGGKAYTMIALAAGGTATLTLAFELGETAAFTATDLYGAEYTVSLDDLSGTITIR